MTTAAPEFRIDCPTCANVGAFNTIPLVITETVTVPFGTHYREVYGEKLTAPDGGTPYCERCGHEADDITPADFNR